MLLLHVARGAADDAASGRRTRRRRGGAPPRAPSRAPPVLEAEGGVPGGSASLVALSPSTRTASIWVTSCCEWASCCEWGGDGEIRISRRTKRVAYGFASRGGAKRRASVGRSACCGSPRHTTSHPCASPAHRRMAVRAPGWHVSYTSMMLTYMGSLKASSTHSACSTPAPPPPPPPRAPAAATAAGCHAPGCHAPGWCAWAGYKRGGPTS